MGKLRGTQRFPKLPPGIQQQLKTLSQLQQQKRLSEDDEKTDDTVDQAIRILSEDIGNLLQKETPFSFNAHESLILSNFVQFHYDL